MNPFDAIKIEVVALERVLAERDALHARATFAERVAIRIGLLGFPRLALYAARLEAGDSPCEAFRRAGSLP